MAIDRTNLQDGVSRPVLAGTIPLPDNLLDRKALKLPDIKLQLETSGVIKDGLSDIDEKKLRSMSKKDVQILQTRLSASGLYVGEENQFYADGDIGSLTVHAVKIAHNPEAAVKHIAEDVMRDKKLDKSEIMQLQASLNRLGYHSGDVDGKIGPKTATALRQFLQDNPDAANNANPEMRKMLSHKIGSGAVKDLFDLKSAPPDSDSTPPKDVPTRTAEGQALLNPVMLSYLDRHPEKRQYLDLCLKAAEKYNLDGNMFANQIFQESDKRFDADAVGPKTKYGRAIGIAQMLPSTAARYGLDKQDLFDPKKSIEAAAHHMQDIMNEHGISQETALIVYNGGGKALKSFQRSTGETVPAIDKVVEEMEERRSKWGTKSRSAYHTQTYEYVKSIVPEFWSRKELEIARNRPENKIEKPPELPAPTPEESVAQLAQSETKPGLSRYGQSDIMAIRSVNANDAPGTDNSMRSSFMSAAYHIGRSEDGPGPAPADPTPAPPNTKGADFTARPFLA